MLLSKAKMHDAKVLAPLNLNAGSIVAMDRAYNDYAQFALARTTPTTPLRIRTAQKAPHKKNGETSTQKKQFHKEKNLRLLSHQEKPGLFRTAVSKNIK